MEDVIIKTVNPERSHPAPGKGVRARENQKHFRGRRRILVEPSHKIINLDDVLKTI